MNSSTSRDFPTRRRPRISTARPGRPARPPCVTRCSMRSRAANSRSRPTNLSTTAPPDTFDAETIMADSLLADTHSRSRKPLSSAGMSADGGAGSLTSLTERVRAFAEEREWQPYHTPKNLAMALAGEVGELLAELQWLTPEQSATVMDDPEAGARIQIGRS